MTIWGKGSKNGALENCNIEYFHLELLFIKY